MVVRRNGSVLREVVRLYHRLCVAWTAAGKMVCVDTVSLNRLKWEATGLVCMCVCVCVMSNRCWAWSTGDSHACIVAYQQCAVAFRPATGFCMGLVTGVAGIARCHYAVSVIFHTFCQYSVVKTVSCGDR